MNMRLFFFLKLKLLLMLLYQQTQWNHLFPLILPHPHITKSQNIILVATTTIQSLNRMVIIIIHQNLALETALNHLVVHVNHPNPLAEVGKCKKPILLLVKSVERPFHRPLTPNTRQFYSDKVFNSSPTPDRFKDVFSSGRCIRCYSSRHIGSL